MRSVETITNNGETYQVHRTWLKRLANPILTKLGWIIVSQIDNQDNFIKYDLVEYPEHCSGPYKVWFKIRRKHDSSL